MLGLIQIEYLIQDTSLDRNLLQVLDVAMNYG
jgi:hypothetical protein